MHTYINETHKRPERAGKLSWSNAHTHTPRGARSIRLRRPKLTTIAARWRAQCGPYHKCTTGCLYPGRTEVELKRTDKSACRDGRQDPTVQRVAQSKFKYYRCAPRCEDRSWYVASLKLKQIMKSFGIAKAKASNLETASSNN